MKAASIKMLIATIGLVMTATPVASAPRPSDIQVDSSAATRTVDAVLNPALTRAKALAIADLPANQALIEQAREFGTGDTRETFADALLAEAQRHGKWSIFNFAEVHDHAADVRTVIKNINSDPAVFTKWIREKIAPFAPPGIPVQGIGYLEAGGPGGGFSVNGRVYVNLAALKGEMDVVRLALTHEFYHGLQHEAQVAAGTRADFEYDPNTYAKLPTAFARSCYATRQLFGSLMNEGTATYVADVALLPTHGTEALSERKQRKASLTGQIDDPIAFLEMGVAAIASDIPVPERKVYSALAFNKPVSSTMMLDM